MRNELIKVIRDSTEIMFHNFYVTLVTCDMDYILCDMPVWKHCYHTLHSCDQWFINPNRLECMIGQMCHFYAHLGNINATTIVATNKWPRVVGMSGLEKGLDKNDLYE
ncbi:MAG: hypothetical protein ACI4IL_08645 [Eubacterium sp.]